MPPAFEREAGAFEVRLPDIRFIRVMDTGYLAEPVFVGFAEDTRERERGEIASVRHTKIERRAGLQDSRGLGKHRVDVGDVFQNRVAQSACEVIRRKGRAGTICLDQGFIRAVFLRCVDRSMPGIQTDIDFLFKRERGEVTITTSNIIDRGWKRQVLIIRRLHRSQKAAEVWDRTDLEE